MYFYLELSWSDRWKRLQIVIHVVRIQRALALLCAGEEVVVGSTGVGNVAVGRRPDLRL